VFDFLEEHISGKSISYLIVLIAAGADVIIPIVPSETIVITAGVVAGNGSLSWPLLIVCAAIGAMLGDNASYWLGRRFGPRVSRRLFKSEKGQERLAWAEQAICRHGPILILVGRFVPGGRTASTFAAGTAGLAFGRFFVADVIACLGWATFATVVGYAGGATFKEEHWKAFALSLGLAAVAGLCAEIWRQIQKRRGRDIFGDPLES
jgi:membrane protein DedA with SNARE-associated domain